MSPTVPAQSRGFTLLEALVALLLVTFAMLMGFGLMARQPHTLERLRAGDEALRAIEASIETIRAGALPLESGFLQPAIAYPAPVHAEHLLLDLNVQPQEVEGLYGITVEARYQVGRKMHRRRVTTLVWRPL